MAFYQNPKVSLPSTYDVNFTSFLRRYYLDTLNDPFVMDDPQCALITEQAYAYFKLPYQEKVGKWQTPLTY